MRAFSLYIHIPFCSHKCPYCDFNTYAVSRVPEEEYIAALLREMEQYRDAGPFMGRRVQTIFFGGGTPSLISPAGIREILSHAQKCFLLEGCAEISIEANPFLVDETRLRGYREAGVNRLSFGAQSFHPGQLSLLGREHSPGDISRALRDGVAAGIENISLDLLFGVPGQTFDDLSRDLETALELPIKHLSTYALTIEPGTPFFQRQERKLFSLPPDETVRKMLDHIPQVLAPHGFRRYEISNFALEGYESRHNTAYWIGDDYLGLGAGAHSFTVSYADGQRKSAERWSNCAHFDRYINETARSSPVSWREQLGVEDLIFEFFYLGLRRSQGVDIETLRRLFGEDGCEKYTQVLAELMEQGLVARDEAGVRLTSEGIALSDSVFERLVP